MSRFAESERSKGAAAKKMKDVIKSRQDDGEYKLINGQRVKVNRRKRRSNLNTYYALAVVLAAVIVLVLCLTVFF